MGDVIVAGRQLVVRVADGDEAGDPGAAVWRVEDVARFRAVAISIVSSATSTAESTPFSVPPNARHHPARAFNLDTASPLQTLV